MSEQHREILNRHWKMLTTYLHPTDDLINALVTEQVIPTSMANDIREGSTQTEKTERMLKSLILRGNNSFRKFRQILFKQEQAFVAEILFDEEADESYFVDVSDFDSYPAFKAKLNPLERKHLIWTLDSKIKIRLLKSEWRKNSDERLEKLQSKIAIDNDEDKRDLNKTINDMKREIAVKNDNLRAVLRDYNILNDDVAKFSKRHQANTRLLMTKSLERGDIYCSASEELFGMADKSALQNSRFKFVDNVVRDIDQRVSKLLGEGHGGTCEVKDFVSVQDLDEKTKRLEELVRELEATVDTNRIRQIEIQALLCPKEKDCVSDTTLQAVQRYLSQQQNERISLLMDIDTLSKKLRGLNNADPNSALHGFKQSVVIGKPAPEIVDHRFLRNHIAVLNADADHFNKKQKWKDNELSALRSELTCLRSRFTSPR